MVKINTENKTATRLFFRLQSNGVFSGCFAKRTNATAAAKYPKPARKLRWSIGNN